MILEITLAVNTVALIGLIVTAVWQVAAIKERVAVIENLFRAHQEILDTQISRAVALHQEHCRPLLDIQDGRLATHDTAIALLRADLDHLKTS